MLKPSILETFGDIAQAIGTNFETYLSVVAQVLQQASGVSASEDVGFDMLEYIVSLREGIMDAWGGILLAYKGSPQGKSFLEKLPLILMLDADFVVVTLQPYVEQIFQLLHMISQDTSRSEGLMRASMGVLG
jgi:importin subunit beta-1